MTSRHPVASCSQGRCDLVVAIYGDHAVYGASDAEEADDPHYWLQLRMEGEPFALFHAHDVPEEVAERLMAQGTQDQTFDDGYSAFNAVKGFLFTEPFYVSHAYDVHAGPHDPSRTSEYEDNPTHLRGLNTEQKAFAKLGTLAHNRTFTSRDLDEYAGYGASAHIRAWQKSGLVEKGEARGTYYPTQKGWERIRDASWKGDGLSRRQPPQLHRMRSRREPP